MHTLLLLTAIAALTLALGLALRTTKCSVVCHRAAKPMSPRGPLPR